jgi:ankyrin repeat protein
LPVTPQQQLMQAVAQDDVTYVRQLLDQGMGVDSDLTDEGISPLMIAQSPEIVTALLAYGASVDRRDAAGRTAMHYLVVAAQADAMLPLLIAAGADPDAFAPGANGETPLLAARELFFEGHNEQKGQRVIRILQRAGASVDAQDNAGYTALITAALNDKPALVRLMVDLGAALELRTRDGMTALSWARALGHRNVEALLLDAGARN